MYLSYTIPRIWHCKYVLVVKSKNTKPTLSKTANSKKFIQNIKVIDKAFCVHNVFRRCMSFKGAVHFPVAYLGLRSHLLDLFSTQHVVVLV